MKTKHSFFIRRLIWVVLILLISLVGSHAQNTLKIKESNNNITEHTLLSIKKINFPSASILVIQKGTSYAEYTLSNISKIYFGSASTEVNAKFAIKPNVRLYPNPVKDHFSIEIQSLNLEPAIIDIVDYVGKVIHTQKVTLNSGHNSFSINSSGFYSGFYLCKISKAYTIETIKFNK